MRLRAPLVSVRPSARLDCISAILFTLHSPSTNRSSSVVDSKVRSTRRTSESRSRLSALLNAARRRARIGLKHHVSRGSGLVAGVRGSVVRGRRNVGGHQLGFLAWKKAIQAGNCGSRRASHEHRGRQQLLSSGLGGSLAVLKAAAAANPCHIARIARTSSSQLKGIGSSGVPLICLNRQSP